MYFSDIIRRSGRSLKSAKVRTILTALAIAVGGFTLTITLAASNGLRHYTDDLIASNFDPAELLVGRDPEVSNNGTPSENPKEFDESVSSIQVGGNNSTLQLKRVTSPDVESLKKLFYAEQVRESFSLNIRYVTREKQKKYTVSAEPYNSAQKPELKAGSLPAMGDIEKGSAVLPDNFVASLGFNSAEAAIGKTVTLNIQQPFSEASLRALGDTKLGQLTADSVKPQEKVFTFKITAVSKKAATSLTFGVPPVLLSNIDSHEIYDFTTKGTADYGKYLYVYLRVKDGNNATSLESAKNDLISKGYYVQSSKDVQKAITQFVNILSIMVGVFGLITVIASVFGIVNTMYISVLERTREIGLMKALGMSRRNISRLFVLEAIWIGFMGGILGSLGGLALGIAMNPWITKKLDLGAGTSLLIFRPLQMVALVAALMLVAALAGSLPARKAGRLDPIEALRTE